jgi:CHAT domain-containing protein
MRASHRFLIGGVLAGLLLGSPPFGAAATAGAIAGAETAVATAEASAAGRPLRAAAFEAAQWAQISSAGAALAQLGARFSAGTDDLARLVRARQDLVEAWQAADRAVKSEATEAARATREGIGAKIAAADAELKRRFPAFADLANPKPLPLARAQALLADDEALIVTLVEPTRTFVFVVTREADAWTRVELGAADLAGIVRRLRRDLSPGGDEAARGAPVRAAESAFGEATAIGGPRFDRRTAYDLHQKLLAPFAPLLSTKTQLLVVADGALTSLPFAVLPTAEPLGDDGDPDALRATAWLIESHAVTTLPSVGALSALRELAQPVRASEPFRGFGAPKLAGPGDGTRSPGRVAGYFRDGVADPKAVESLAPLPQTAEELRRMAAALKAPASAVTLGEAATETALKKADLSKARVVAFATHGLLAGEIEGLAEPALVMTPPQVATRDDDGLFTASDAAKLKLAADWVVLSACNTAASDGTPGADGLSGLARAFFYAGARTLLVSHWPVRDDAAARLTTAAFAERVADPKIGKAEAFRRSMQKLARDPSDPSLAHPGAWAPFVVVGENR